MYGFDYQRPTTMRAAVAAAAVDDGAYLAGGMTLLPALKMRLSRRSSLVDLSAVQELAGIQVEGQTVRIGAMSRHADVADSVTVARVLPGLARLAGGIGDPLVRNRGTLGGSLANSDPAADYPGAVLALDATITTNLRQIAAADYFTGMFTTALAPGELIVNVSFRVPRRSAYLKFRNPASRYAVVGVMVADYESGVRVAVTGAGAHAFRLPSYEHALSRSFAPAALLGLAVPSDELNSDMHASAEYRAHLVNVIAARAVTAAAG